MGSSAKGSSCTTFNCGRLALAGVSGIGPKVAIAILSGGTPRELLRAIAAGDAKRFQAVPGVGKRTSERVIVERFRGQDVRIVSEEAGVIGDGRFTVVVDPIDGSLNAKRGIPFFSISLAVAAWMVYVLETTDLDDPQADRLKAALAGASKPAAVVDALLGVESVFTPDLRESAVFRALLVEHVSALMSRP